MQWRLAWRPNNQRTMRKTPSTQPTGKYAASSGVQSRTSVKCSSNRSSGATGATPAGRRERGGWHVLVGGPKTAGGVVGGREPPRRKRCARIAHWAAVQLASTQIFKRQAQTDQTRGIGAVQRSRGRHPPAASSRCARLLPASSLLKPLSSMLTSSILCSALDKESSTVAALTRDPAAGRGMARMEGLALHPTLHPAKGRCCTLIIAVCAN
jgi:hypothetical protein